jgi:chaperonin GroEL
MGEGMLRDVAALTGAKFFDGAANQRIVDIKPEDLGMAQKIVASKHETTVVAGGEDTKAKRITELNAQIKATDREFEKESLRERIAKLNNALFTIKVGGVTDTERQERKLRVEDAINATRAALTDGVVAGGGSALFRAAMLTQKELYLKEADDESMGIMAVINACKAPILQMALNGNVILDRSDYNAILEDKTKTLDFKTAEVVDAFEQGIIDPSKVVTSALQNAASAAALFLISEAAVVLKEAPKEEQL